MVEDTQVNRLHQTIRYRQLFTLGVGTIVGVAWLMVLGSVLSEAGPVGASIAFTLGACAMIPIALCYAEVAGALPFAGGEIVYAFEVFGIKVAYVAGLCLAFVYLINCVFFSVSVGWLINKLIPGIQGPLLYISLGDKVYLADIVIGVTGTLLIGAANYRGAHVAARLQDVATYSLLLASCVFVAAGLWGGHTRNISPAFGAGGSHAGVAGILSVLAVTPYFFGGFNTIPQALSEVKHDGRTHIGGVVGVCIVVSLAFYCLVLIAVSMVMPRRELLAFDLPIPESFAVALHSRVLGNVVLIAGVLGLIATWNAVFFASARVLFVLGRSSMVHSAFGIVHPRTGVPSHAIVAATMISLAGTLLGKGVLLPVVNVTSTILAFLYVIVTLATWRYRKLKPNAPRPYLVPGKGVLLWFAIFFSGYLVGSSLFQQYVASPYVIPVEWAILLFLSVAGVVMWHRSRKLRETLTDEERRKAIL